MAQVLAGVDVLALPATACLAPLPAPSEDRVHISDTQALLGLCRYAFLGNLTDCHVSLEDGTRVRVQLDPRKIVDVGQRVLLRFDTDAASVFAL